MCVCVLCPRIDPLRCLAGCCRRRLNQGLVVALDFFSLLDVACFCVIFSVYGCILCLVRYLFVISTSVIDCLGRFVLEMTYYMSSGTLNLTKPNWTLFSPGPTCHNSKANFTKLYTQVGTGLTKNWLNFGIHLPQDPDPELVWSILQHFEMVIFQHFCLYLWRNLQIFMKISSQMYVPVVLDKDVLNKFWNSSGLRIWTWDTHHICTALFIVRLILIVFWIYQILLWTVLNFG